MKGKVRPTVFALLAVLSLLLFAGVSSASAATINSDLPDYPPGATVTLTGAGWQAGENVSIIVTDDVGAIVHTTGVQADAAGGFVDVFQLPAYYVSIYTAVATGSVSGVATTTFTDATPISNHFSQAANGGKTFTGVAEWIGGILNAVKTTYKEGMSSPQRLVIDDGPAASLADAGGYRSYTFGIALLDSDSYAYDFPTGTPDAGTYAGKLWGQALDDAAAKDLDWVELDPLKDLGQANDPARITATFLLPASYGGTGGGTLTFVDFPDFVDLGTTAAAVEMENRLAEIITNYEAEYGNRQLALYHDGSITEISMSAELQGSITDGGQVYVDYTVTYRAGSPAPNQMFLAWGCHIAVGYDGGVKTGGIDDDWGLGLGAGSIPGGSYHCKNVAWDPDGNIGSQDNQIMSASVIAPGVKAGYKFNDLDNDHVRDEGEPGLGDWDITCTGETEEGAPVSATVKTLTDGYYEFILDPGDYTVYETLKSGWMQTRPYAGMTPPVGETIVDAANRTKAYAFSMVEAGDLSHNDFGNRVNQGRIIVKKVITPPGYPDEIADTDFPFTVTGPSGPWSFNLDLLDQDPPDDWFDTWDSGKIDIGTYVVTELIDSVPGDWYLVSIVTTDEDESVIDKPNEKVTLDLDPDETITVTFTDTEGGNPPDKSGTKFEDLNADGVRDFDEPGLPGWTIYVDYDDDGVLDADDPATPDVDETEPSAVTDANGDYTIGNFKSGFFKIREVPQAGWTCSYPALGYYEDLWLNWRSYTGNDFGNWHPATKSGMKFEDLDADGVKDPGEPGLGGWTIYVDYNTNMTPDPGEPSAVTAAGTGAYTITGIDPGTWYVLEAAPESDPRVWVCSFPNAGPTAAETDPVTGAVTSSEPWYYETFDSSDAKTGNDFGNWTTASKSGHKFHDLDADGFWDALEPGLEGWTIFVDYDGEGDIDPGEPRAVTDADGYYMLTGIEPGTWEIWEITVPGWVCSYPNPGVPAPVTGVVTSTQPYYIETFASGDALEGNDFGNWTTAWKGGHKYEDLDADGVIEAADVEKPLAEWTIFIDYDDDGVKDAGEPSAVTDIEGEYLISGIVPGTWKVKEVLKGGWTQSYPALGYHEDTFVSNGEYYCNDFANYRQVVKSGYKWHDLDADGVWDAGEPGLEDWTIRLDGTAGSGAAVSLTDATDATGYYEFTVDPGVYVVSEELKIDWRQSYPVSNMGTYPVTLLSGDAPHTHNDFGNYQYATKSGMKFEDVDADGVKDAGEDGLSGWTIELYASDGAGGWDYLDSVTTDAAGHYAFSELTPGRPYVVVEGKKAGWFQSYPNASTPDPAGESIFDAAVIGFDYGPFGYRFTPSSGETLRGNDFGNYQQATKSGYKFEDMNTDGVWDPDGLDDETGTYDDEVGLDGWTIKLDGYDGMGNAVHKTTTTDATGRYEFTVDPGEYTVSEEPQTDWYQSYPDIPGDGDWDIVLESGDDDTGNNFGNYQKARKSGYKFEDLDADGNDREADEPGLEGWTIEAVQDGEVVASTTTNEDGYYQFDLKPGVYTFREVQKAGWTQSYPAAPGTHSHMLLSGALYRRNNFGNWYPATKSGVKFFDLDADGQPREAGEPGLSGWTIFVDYNDNGTLNAGEPSAVTGGDGSYTILGIKPGTWKVREVQKDWWTCSFPSTVDAYGAYYEHVFTSRASFECNDFGNWAHRAKTPGYWKNHTEVWSGDECPRYDGGYYVPGTWLAKTATHPDGVFTIPAGYSPVGRTKKAPRFENSTLLDALSFGGGSTLNGKAQILFRAATAALLNATHTEDYPMTSYPYSDQQIVEMVDAALAEAVATGDASVLTDLAADLDYLNNAFDF